MNPQTIAQAVRRGTARSVTIGICTALTVFAVLGLAIDLTSAEIRTTLQKERSRMNAQESSDSRSYLPAGVAQFFGPPPPEKASQDDGIRFIHTDPHLLDGHRPYHDVHHHNTNVSDGGALMFNWTFDK